MILARRAAAESSPVVPPGVVTRTAPPAGTVLPAGQTAVTVYVSRGVATTVGQVTVPGVVGLDRASAEARLSGAGLRVQVQSSAGGSVGRVKSQSPAAGSRVPAGSTVTIVVATG